MKKLVIILSVLLGIGSSNNTYSQGCVEATSDEGVQVVGYIQPEFDYYFFGNDTKGNALKPSSFYFKRARIGVVGNIPYDISYYVMAELSPVAGGPQLLDAYITYAPFGKYLKFSIGQYKSPFSLELNTPCHALHTIRRSTVVNEMAAPFRELGFMLLGSFGKERDIVSYRLAVLNGTGINNVLSSTHYDDNQNKDIAGRIVVSPLEGLKVGGSYRHGLVEKKDVDGDSKSKTSWAVDLSLEKFNVLIQGEYISGKYIGDIAGGGGCGGKSTDGTYPEYSKSGFWLMAMYKFDFGLQTVVKFETYDPDGSAYKFIGQTQTITQSTTTFGINYFINDWTRVQLNYLYNSEGKKSNGDVGEYDNDALMFQVQVKF
jgi:phosphate-selective porin